MFRFRIQILYLFAGFIGLVSCENEFESEFENYNCYGTLANPQVTLLELNSDSLEIDGVWEEASVFVWLADYQGDCFDSNVEVSVFIEFLDSDDNLMTTSSFVYSSLPVTETKLTGYFKIAYRDADKAVMKWWASSHISNTVQVEIPRPTGAN